MPADWRLQWVRGKRARHSSRVSKLPFRSKLDSFTKALVCALKASHLEKAHPCCRWAPTFSEFTNSSIKHIKEVFTKQNASWCLAATLASGPSQVCIQKQAPQLTQGRLLARRIPLPGYAWFLEDGISKSTRGEQSWRVNKAHIRKHHHTKQKHNIIGSPLWFLGCWTGKRRSGPKAEH